MNRDNQGRFARNSFVRQSVIALVLIIITTIACGIYFYKHPTVITNTVEVDTSPAMFTAKIDSLEKSVVEAVRKCESAGHKESDGMIIFDSNHVASVGTLQFQVHTVIFYEKSLYGKVITPKEAILIALDDTQSGQLAQDIMFKGNNLANDWLNCSNKLSLADQIKAIKKIK